MMGPLFDGITFTGTHLGANEKKKMMQMVLEMGGLIDHNLTPHTNVLIVGDINTEKVKYCLQNRTDITLLYPNDLSDIYKRYIGNEPNLSLKNLDDYPWPIFNSCFFCLSRLRDVENTCFSKPYITKLIEHFGGTSTAALSPNINYLITDKRDGKRYESAIKWNILPVHPKWIIDCCNCQRILDPSLYDISQIDSISMIGVGSHKSIRNIVDYGTIIDNPIWEKLTRLGNSPSKSKVELTRNNENFPDLITDDKNFNKRRKNGIFNGFVFACFGFNESQTDKLSEILKKNGAEVQDNYDLNLTHIIIPSSFTIDLIPEKIDRLQDISDTKILNEWFIERCLYYKKIVNDSWSLPAKKLSLDYKLNIHITGFLNIENLHLTKLIKNLNLTLSKNFNENCDFLIANLSSLGLNRDNSAQLFEYKFNDILILDTLSNDSTIALTKKKINSAKKWNIPVLSLAFIWELSQTGILPNVLDSKWCIFAPRSLRPANNFLEYVRSISGRTLQTQKSDENLDKSPKRSNNDNFSNINPSSNESPIKLPTQLPSPSKKKSKKWVKLIGTATESQIKSTDLEDSITFKSARKLTFDDNDIGNNNSKRNIHDDYNNDEESPIFKRAKR